MDLAPVAALDDDLVRPRVLVGPRADWLARPGDLTEVIWVVSTDVNRVGLRLQGPALSWAPSRVGTELVSEASCGEQSRCRRAGGR